MSGTDEAILAQVELLVGLKIACFVQLVGQAGVSMDSFPTSQDDILQTTPRELWIRKDCLPPLVVPLRKWMTPFSSQSSHSEIEVALRRGVFGTQLEFS